MHYGRILCIILMIQKRLVDVTIGTTLQIHVCSRTLLYSGMSGSATRVGDVARSQRDSFSMYHRDH